MSITFYRLYGKQLLEVMPPIAIKEWFGGQFDLWYYTEYRK